MRISGARSGRLGRLLGVLVLALAAAPASALGASGGTPATAQVANDTPPPVAAGTAVALGAVAPSTGLDLNVGLGVRDPAGLDALIAAASTPGSPSYGHYLTNAQYLAQYAPTGAQASAATAWLKSSGLDVTGVSPDNLLIHVHASVADIDRVFGLQVENFRAAGRTFRANDRAPQVPANLDISDVSGLSNFVVYEPDTTCTPPPGSKCGYDGSDFRSAYNVVGDGTGQMLGFTLWGEALPQSDYTNYATNTGTTALTIGQAGDDGLNFIPVGGTTTESDTDGEVALDTEIAHGVAPGIHETYWLGHDNGSIMETVLNDAANSSISVISNSWGAQNSGCPTNTNMESALQHGAATGKTFYFSTGDSGAASGCEYPATSQYVVAVGGTTLNSITNETALQNGGGCSNAEPRPSWQTGIGTPLTSPGGGNCTGRATPDVSADSGIGTYLYLDGSPSCCTGGTSLATPIWAAASTIWNKHNAATGRPGIGFDAPLIYQLANDPTTYAHDFHDITSGTNGFAAVTGWDEATGWGSPNFDKIANNPATITYTGPTSANHGDGITLSATLFDQGASTPLVGAKISFAAAGESCDATTNSSGAASCNVTINDAPGHYSAIAAFAGDAVYDATSATVPFTVNNIPTTVTYTGPTTGPYGVPVTLTAKLTDNSNSAGIAGETLHIAFGAESCSGSTDSSGAASCSVTPLDSPGGSPYTITASFAGDAPTYLASSDTSKSFTVMKAPTVTTLAISPPSPSVFGQPVTLTATVSPNDNGGSVEFFDGATPIAGCSAQALSGSGHTATCVTGGLSVGNHMLAAAYSGDGNYLGSPSALAPYTVNKAMTSTTLTASPAGSSTFGQAVTFTAAVAPVAPGAGVPTGTVAFTVDGTAVGTGTLSGTSHASITTSSLGAGSHTIGAAYSGDGNFLASSTSLPYLVTCSVTISGTHVGTLEVTSSTCVKPGAVVKGAINIHATGALDVEGASVSGAIDATGTTGVVRVCGSNIGGTVDIRNALALVIVGDPGDAACAPNTIGAALVVENNTHGVEVIGNTEHGLISSGNSGPGPFPGDPTTISGNHG
ncbi:MAG TPA: Ig-like domain repeat protein [Solirubrobacteraceae bacterium]|nr:Ig-like domain repeat protein [Solirubrobacteraceae bacterium]